MGCICPKQKLGMAKSNSQATKQLMEKDEETVDVGNSSILSSREQETNEIKILAKEEVDWYSEIKSIVQESRIEELVEEIEDLIIAHRAGANGKL